jgi:sterol 3beta-glucosyltransferase
LQPLAASRELPPIGLRPPRRPWPGWVNLLLYRVLALLTWQMLRPACQEVRRQLGREPYPWWGPFFGRSPGRERILFGFSELVVPRPGSWPRGHMVTGYWTAEDETRHWRPSAQLQSFLQAGPPPVYIGFGSMCGHDAQALTQVVLRAIALSGRRAVLARGWGGLAETAGDAGDTGNQVIWVDHVPHGWLLPQVAMAIHHGGAGTTAASLRAGVPSVVLPFFGDQPYWASRLHDLGVAPPPLSRMEAMTMAASDALRQRAAQLGQQLRAEQGAERAVALLQQWALLSSSAHSPEARPPLRSTPDQPVSSMLS